jgi:DNA polymerase-3 subunit gamma/tau
VGLGEVLASGYDPRRVADDLLTTARDAFLLVAGRGRVEVDGPADEVERLRTLGDDAGPAQLVRVIETVGQAVVDMRGADAADPRLVLEVALVRLARRDAGPPLQVLAERVERLERRADNPTVRPAASAPSRPDPNAIEPPVEAVNRPRPPRSLGAMREDRAVQVPPDAPATAPPDASAALPAEAGAAETAPAPAAVATEARAVSLDDVIVAWAAVLPRLPPATRAAAQEAQPIALEGGVVTFGIPKNLIGAARPRFHKERDNIREALTEQLGALLKFQLAELAGFGELPPQGSSASGGGDEDVVDLTEIDDAVPADVAVDSVGLLTQRFDATVVEERPRD